MSSKYRHRMSSDGESGMDGGMEVLRTFEHGGVVLEVFAYGAEPFSPARASSRRAPGAGGFEIGRIDLTAEGDGLVLRARVSGKNIAYIYTDIQLKDPNLDRYYGPVAREYVRAGRNKETRGISRPDWDDPVELAAVIRPGLRLLNDGTGSTFCFSLPEGYGDPEYRLPGLYTFADGAGPLRAVVTFDGAGSMSGVVAHKQYGRRLTPRAVTPQPGDRFSPFVQVLAPAAAGDWEVETALSAPLTFRGEPFRVVTETPIPGDYLVGLVVEDLDGMLTRKYAPATITGDGIQVIQH
jgi:hypothetical protein